MVMRLLIEVNIHSFDDYHFRPYAVFEWFGQIARGLITSY